MNLGNRNGLYRYVGLSGCEVLVEIDGCGNSARTVVEMVDTDGSIVAAFAIRGEWELEELVGSLRDAAGVCELPLGGILFRDLTPSRLRRPGVHVTPRAARLDALAPDEEDES